MDFSHFDVRLLEAGSVIGRNHVLAGLPNQDAVCVKRFEYGNILVVADGVGSDSHSELASQAAVEAVIDVFSMMATEGIEEEDIAEYLCNLFTKHLQEKYDKYASTTCVFCAHLFEIGVFLGQIGDGICCGYQNGDSFVLSEKNADFANIVEALSPNCSPALWKLYRMNSTKTLELMIATDGIADDILPGKEAAFAHHLISIFESSAIDGRNSNLLDMLRNWETPQSFDDKSIVLYHCILSEDE